MSKVLLGDVAVEHKETCKGSKDGYPIVGLEHLIPEEITLTAWNEGSENTFSKMFRKGNVLFGRRRAYLKKAAVAPFDGICSGDITVIEAKPDRILPELLPFIIQNDDLFEFAVGKSAGSLSPRVKWEHLKNYEFELPDMEKQKELAELLWAMDNTKKSYQKLIAATDELVKSQFIERFGDFKSNPKGLEITTIDQLFSVGSSKRVFQKDWKSSGVPFYRAREIVKLSEQGFVDNELFITEEMYQEYAARYGVPQPGDIMVTGVGTLGICYLVQPKDRFYYKDGNILCFHSLGRIDSRFVVECYKMPFIREQIEANAGGSTVGTYTIETASKTRIFNPPIEEQQEFVAFVRQSDKSKFELEKALSELTATYKRIIAENLG